MKILILPKTAITTSQLGFGCSSIMGAGASRQRQRLLETAYDSGVLHFDTARYYGYGEAEAVLGDFARTRRSKITITTKFGIQPPAKNALRNRLVAVARYVARLHPGIRKTLTRQKSTQVTTGAFGPDEARISLETSLRELKSDYVDIFLLHAPSLPTSCSDDLLAFLQKSIEEGKIRSFGIGIGTDIDTAIQVGESRPAFAKVLQFENSVVRQHRSLLHRPDEHALITHRALSESYTAVLSYIRQQTAVAAEWSRLIGANCADPEILANLMLAWAVRDNSNGIVLFSTRSEERIRSNITAVESLSESLWNLDQFADLVEQASIAV